MKSTAEPNGSCASVVVDAVEDATERARAAMKARPSVEVTSGIAAGARGAARPAEPSGACAFAPLVVSKAIATAIARPAQARFIAFPFFR